MGTMRSRGSVGSCNSFSNREDMSTCESKGVSRLNFMKFMEYKKPKAFIESVLTVWVMRLAGGFRCKKWRVRKRDICDGGRWQLRKWMSQENSVTDHIQEKELTIGFLLNR